MKRLLRLFAVGACLLLGGVNMFLAAEEPDEAAPDSHDLMYRADLGAKRMFVQTKTAALTTTSAAYQSLTSGNIQIPAGQTGHLVVTFSGESVCTGGSWCTLRVLVDGTELHPIVGTDFAFDSPSDNWEAHSIQRISKPLVAGIYTVDVQWAALGGATFRIDDWLFMVEYWRAT